MQSMKRWKPSLLGLFVLMAFLFGLWPAPAPPPAYGWSDSGLSCAPGTQVSISNFSPAQAYYIGVWNVVVYGATSGSGKAVYLNTKKDGGGNGYNFIASSNYSAAAREMNGEPSFVTSRVSSIQSTISWGSGSQNRAYIRPFAELCGGYVENYDQGTVYVVATAYPSATISPPSTIKAGEQVKISISGTSFVARTYTSISYKFYVNSSQVDSGSGTKTFSKQVSYTFQTAGTYTLTLEVTDGVGRTTTERKTVTVQGTPQPPPPPAPGNMPPVADFDMPSSAEVNEAVTVTDCSEDYDGTIVQRTWSVTPSSYTGTLSGTGGTVRFTQTGTYAVTLTVKDDKGATDECTKYITVGEAPPPPPPPVPPEPENMPPVAQFSLPSECGPGETVNVTNRSYDPDGFIADVEWQVTPSKGVTNNLGDGGGTLVFDELGTYTVRLTVVDDRGDSDTAEEQIEVVNRPPTAKIVVPDKIVQGEDVIIRSASSDPDGQIVRLMWSVIPAEGMVGQLSGESSTVYFDRDGEYTITLTVEDNWGATDTDTVTISAEPAIPQAFFTDQGAYKQNRRIVLTEAGQSSARYPIIKEQDEWEILPAGNGATPDAIKVKHVAPDRKEVLFKSPGTYKVRLRVTNTAGHSSEWYERTFDIAADQPPVADFVVQPSYLRDVTAGKKATVEVRDTSYSPDGDVIAHRTWKYRYDSDNDGSFDDETWVVFSDANNASPSFQTDQVGKYLIELVVTEGFGEDTIAEFVSASDYLKADTLAKPQEEKIAEVINVRPSVAFNVLRKKKADIVFTVGQTTLTPSVSWTNQYLDKGQFTQVIEAESSSAAKSGTWSLGAGGTAVFLSNGSVQATFTQAARAVYIQLYNCDHNDGYAEVYVDGVYYGRQDTRNQGHFACEITNLSNAAHTVEIRTTGTGDLHVDYFAAKAVAAPAFDAAIAQYLDGLINQYLKPELEANNVDYQISSVQAYSMTMQDTFNWQVYDHVGRWGESTGGYYTGQNHIIVVGKDVYFYGYGRPAFKDFLFMPDNTMGKKTFTFDLSESGINYHSMEGGGFLFNSKIENGILSGYVILFAQSGIELYRIPGVNVNSFHDEQTYLLANAPYASKLATFTKALKGDHSIRIEVTADRLDLWDNGNKVIDGYALPYQYGNGFGPIASYDSHNCSMLSWFVFKNLVMTVASGKTLDEVLQGQVAWRDDAARFLVNISAVPYPEFNDPVKAAYIYSTLLDDRIDFSVLGSGANQTQALSVIAKNDGQGTFILNTSRATAMQQLTSYIISKLNSLYPPVENYVLLNEEVYYRTYYNDLENDPKYAERWYYSHDPDYFENSLGLASFNEQWLPAPVYRFDKVGEFVATFQARDNPKDDNRFDGYRLWSYMPADSLHLYVHRRPVAVFGVQLTQNGNYYNVTINSSAYDLDHFSRPDKGIVEHKWSWRPAASATWTAGKPISLTRDNDYLVRYEVKDVEGVWSYPVVRLVSTRNVNLPPVAQFTVAPNPVVVNQTVTVTDLSYDPDGDQIVERQWRVKPPGGSWGSAMTTPPTKFGTVGEWEVELKVRDNGLATTYTTYQQQNIDFTGEGGSYAQWEPQFDAPSGGVVTTIEFRTAVANDDYYRDGEVRGYKNGSWYLIKSYGRQPEDAAVSDTLDVTGLGYTKIKFYFRMYDSAGDAYGDGDGSYYKITVATTSATGLWSEPYYQTVQVIPDNTAPVAQFTVAPNPVVVNQTVTVTDLSYDPDGDPIVAREWRYRKDGGAWKYVSEPPTVFADAGGPGTYDIELRVQDQPRLPQLTPKWSDWYRQTLTVLPSFEARVLNIQPDPAERGRDLLIRAAAIRLFDGQRMAVDRMKVVLPLPQKPDGSPALPPGGSSHEAWMTYDSESKTYTYTYRVPGVTAQGRWPDDGLYTLKVVGYKDSVAKEDTENFRVKGHVLERVIIKTESW